MPGGFDLCSKLRDDINPYGLNQNCYFCTVAALKNMEVGRLVALSQTMQQNGAGRAEIEELFGAAKLSAKPFIRSGLNIAVASPSDWCNSDQAQYIIASSISSGQYCAVDFVRADNTGHMVVAYRQRDQNGSIVCADFQVPPDRRQVVAWPPEGGHGYRYAIWLNTEIEELCESFARLTI